MENPRAANALEPVPARQQAATPAPADSPFSRSVQLALLMLAALAVGVLGGLTVLEGHLSQRPVPVVETRLDLNRATPGELALLPGVGPALAERIVLHRQQKGPFRSVEELVQVSGIGPVMLERLRDRVHIGSAEPVSHPPPPSSISSPNPTRLLDPNTATLSELDTLPGIGPKLAQRIVEERARRPFAAVADLRRVKGIGPKTLDKLRPHVRIVTNDQESVPSVVAGLP